MRPFLNATNSRLQYSLFYLLLFSSSFIACKKNDAPTLQRNDSSEYSSLTASKYSSDVIDKWITIQLRLIRNSVGIPNPTFSRPYAYSGVAAFLSLSPGTSLYALDGKLNGITNMPQVDKAKMIFWPASVNTALAFINRNMFPAATDADKAAVDSLENALNNFFLSKKASEVVAASNAFGEAIATTVFNWSENDGYKHASDPYTPPVGPGLWIPTPPAFAPATIPYWGDRRPIITGSIFNTQPAPPVAYSEDPKSPFYQMVKQVYDASQKLTRDDSAKALFWRDIPGVSSPGHWLSIVQQVIQQTKSPLDKAAFAYALSGVCVNDALISNWKSKYRYNLVRPVTYIQNVMGYTDWLSLITTPSFPEYPSAHGALSAAAAKALTSIYGDIGSFTDHTYDYMGFAPGTYKSFRAIANEAGISRFYGGIHYQPSIEAGLMQGRKVTGNILRKLRLNERED